MGHIPTRAFAAWQELEKVARDAEESFFAKLLGQPDARCIDELDQLIAHRQRANRALQEMLREMRAASLAAKPE
jgi:hypothetical protein